MGDAVSTVQKGAITPIIEKNDREEIPTVVPILDQKVTLPEGKDLEQLKKAVGEIQAQLGSKLDDIHAQLNMQDKMIEVLGKLIMGLQQFLSSREQLAKEKEEKESPSSACKEKDSEAFKAAKTELYG